MKKLFTVVLFAGAFFAASLAQSQTHVSNSRAAYIPAKRFNFEEAGSAISDVASNNFFPSDPFSSQFVIPGSNRLPITSRYDVGTNSRSMHNLAVDPDNPLKMHFISMVTTNSAASDTVGGLYPSRRVVYTYSSDGGVTWKAPVIVGGVRLGFPNLILYKRNGNYVPIISAHNGPNSGTSNWVIQTYIEQGNPGDGNFKLFATDRKASDGNTKDMGFPVMALSTNQDTLYMLGCVVSQTGSTAPQNLEFGAYALDANQGAKWLGWTVEPGGLGIEAALCGGGRDQMRVAANGKIGVFWGQGETTDNGLYYVESTDGGVSWTQNYPELYVPDQSGPGGLLGDYDGMDFYFDKSNNPHFLWQADYQVASGNTFYPYSAMIFYWGVGDATVKILTVNSNAAPAFSTVTINGTDLNVDILNQSSYFTPPTQAGTEPTGIAFISKLTTAFTANPNYFRVYYSTYQDGDTLTVDQTGDGTSIKTYLYRSIYFQETTDGGSHWSDPAPFVANNPSDPSTNKLDYHFPAASFMNPPSGAVTNYHVNFLVDSFPGEQFGFGQAGWTDNTWYHASQAVNKVTPVASNEVGSLSQNYPNPFVGSTTIPFVLKNDGNVTLSVTDILGREVAVIYRGRLSSGYHTLPFATSRLSAGVYTYTLQTPDGNVARTMSILK